MDKYMGTNFDIVKLNEEQLNNLLCLFSECFKNDPYYLKIFSNTSIQEELMGLTFSNTLLFCLRKDGAYGIFEDKKLIAFLLLFNYHKTKSNHAEQFEAIFKRDSREKEFPYKQEIHDKIAGYGHDVIYILSIGVSKDYRRRGIAGKLIDFAIENYQNHYLVSDVSNASSIPIYEERNFKCEKIDDDYFLVIREPI